MSPERDTTAPNWLHLHPDTGNIIANLQLKDSHYKNQDNLPLASAYPGTLSFVEETND